MDHVDWSPKGDDGASTEDAYGTGCNLGGLTVEQIEDAVAVFVSVAGAMAHDETELARVIWEGFYYRTQGSFNPAVVFVEAGVVCVAEAIRRAAGDSEPGGPPSGQFSLMLLASDADSGEFVDMEEIDLAATLIGHAANWDWESMHQVMDSKLKGNEVDDELLLTLGAVLMSIYIGVSGLESASRGT